MAVFGRRDRCGAGYADAGGLGRISGGADIRALLTAALLIAVALPVQPARGACVDGRCHCAMTFFWAVATACGGLDMGLLDARLLHPVVAGAYGWVRKQHHVTAGMAAATLMVWKAIGHPEHRDLRRYFNV